jgi:hypothetical protein
MTAPAEPIDPSTFLRRALSHAVCLGARELRIGEAQAVVVDGLGREARLERAGVAVVPDLAALAAHVGSWGYWPDERHTADAVAFEDLGAWSFRTDRSGTLVLKARRPPAPCLEALFEAPPEDLAALRGLYRHGGVDVRVHCEGGTRAREVALAIVGERRMLGLPTALSLAREARSAGAGSAEPAFDGDYFDVNSSPDAGWEVAEPALDPYGRPVGGAPALPASGSRVIVRAERTVPWPLKRKEALDAVGRPMALLLVEIQKSSPVASVLLSPEARALSKGSEPFDEAPWDAFVARRDARRTARPAKPRTWHRTTEAVAEAFAARQAPRGLISGGALYFHGPVAYSLSDRNPIAAFVAAADGKPLLLTGRGQDRGGTKAGIVTGAEGDIRSATNDMRSIDVEDIVPLLRLGGHGLAGVPFRDGRHGPGEALPREAEILPDALSAWVSTRHAELEAELDASYATRFPTWRQASAYHALARHAQARDALCEALRIELPDAGEADDLRRRAEGANKAASRRQAERDARARLQRDVERAENALAAAPGP